MVLVMGRLRGGASVPLYEVSDQALLDGVPEDDGGLVLKTLAGVEKFEIYRRRKEERVFQLDKGLTAKMNRTAPRRHGVTEKC
jgi:hypothetical protein